jgi:hypothetical protein
MLLIVSDLHLSDGTCAESITPRAFTLFSERAQELAFNASWDKDGIYRPIETVDIVLLGDILDPLHSNLWLDTAPGSPEYVRPWTDPNHPRFAAKLHQITRGILRENREGLEILSRLSHGEAVKLPPASKGQPDYASREFVFPRFRTYYMRGNHDWCYGLPGPQFDAIRTELIELIGLSNPSNMFPWAPEEFELLRELFAEYRVYARHGDIYDSFNYCKERGRNSSALGNVFGIEMLNRFPITVQQQLGDRLPAPLLHSLRMLANVRPALATPLWITGQIRHYAGSHALQDELKAIWDKLGDEFLEIDFVKEQDKVFEFDLVDAMRLVIKISQRTSLNTINDLIIWVRDKWGGELSFASHALQEPALLNNQACYIAYGHTHHQETVSLDLTGLPPDTKSEVYFNSGTWHSYYDLAVKKPDEQKFVPHQTMTYLVFYKPHERGSRNFETWTGTFD